MTLVCKFIGNYGCGVKMTPDINSIYAGFETSCPRDSKNVSVLGIPKMYPMLR